jgi:hypothetical protein
MTPAPGASAVAMVTGARRIPLTVPNACVPHLSLTAVAWMRVKMPRAAPARAAAASAAAGSVEVTARTTMASEPKASTAQVRADALVRRLSGP